MNPDIPQNSFNVQLRLQHVSYYQVIHNGVLAAQLVSFIPEQLSSLLKVDSDDILVLAIRDASRHSAGSKRSLRQRDNRIDNRGDFRKRDLVTSNSGDDAVLVIVSIPKSHYWTLSGLLKDPKSGLYTPSPESFGQYIDAEYPLSNRPPEAASKGGNNSNPLTGDHLGTGDPNLVTNPDANGGSSSHGAIIGSLVGLATVAYVGIAMLVIRRYRRRRQAEQDEADRRLQLQRSISAPITVPVNVQGGSQGWGWQGQ
ncbi:hypothetical protein K457DRAFT_288157 [Linnemannia elongata AG-77]|uniref:Uncharacterized protein n=1 Tax=Linnemannia elongata AG-77 TaxID=1314771 RepID=A0A197K790_9FUNG|nr:hypothetical protein K457DRAFT_288157 [Linnemannia elongata AG-77]